MSARRAPIIYFGSLAWLRFLLCWWCSVMEVSASEVAQQVKFQKFEASYLRT